MIAWGIAAGWFAAWLVTARWLFGRWRGTLKSLGGSMCPQCWARRRLADGTETAARAMLAALAWPVTLGVFLVVLKPPPTAAERADVPAKMAARVAELEAELGMQRSTP